MQLDFGGIAKGWIVDQAVTLLSRYSDACAVNAGGDMRFIGHSPIGLGWPVELEDPRDPSQSIARLTVTIMGQWQLPRLPNGHGSKVK